MSREEELAAKGQALEDYASAKKLAATLQSDLQHQVDLLYAAIKIIEGTAGLMHGPTNRVITDAPWPRLLSYDQIQERLTQYTSESERLSSLSDRLRAMGADV